MMRPVLIGWGLLAVALTFVLALVAWVGHTIATVQVEAEPATEETSEPASEPESLRDASGS